MSGNRQRSSEEGHKDKDEDPGSSSGANKLTIKIEEISLTEKQIQKFFTPPQKARILKNIPLEAYLKPIKKYPEQSQKFFPYREEGKSGMKKKIQFTGKDNIKSVLNMPRNEGTMPLKIPKNEGFMPSKIPISSSSVNTTKIEMTPSDVSLPEDDDKQKMVTNPNFIIESAPMSRMNLVLMTPQVSVEEEICTPIDEFTAFMKMATSTDIANDEISDSSNTMINEMKTQTDESFRDMDSTPMSCMNLVMLTPQVSAEEEISTPIDEVAAPMKMVTSTDIANDEISDSSNTMINEMKTQTDESFKDIDSPPMSCMNLVMMTPLVSAEEETSTSIDKVAAPIKMATSEDIVHDEISDSNNTMMNEMKTDESFGDKASSSGNAAGGREKNGKGSDLLSFEERYEILQKEIKKSLEFVSSFCREENPRNQRRFRHYQPLEYEYE